MKAMETWSVLFLSFQAFFQQFEWTQAAVQVWPLRHSIIIVDIMLFLEAWLLTEDREENGVSC